MTNVDHDYTLFYFCLLSFLYDWRPLDELSGTRYCGLTDDTYDIQVLEMYVMYLVFSRGSVLHSLPGRVALNYVFWMFLVSSAHAMEIQQN